MEQRRQIGLCFRCRDMYYSGNQCKRQLLLLEGEDRELIEEGETSEPVKYGDEDNGEISIHALKGLMNNKIIKVEGRVKDCSLMILVDSGSTHNFLDEGTTRRLNC